MKTYLAALLLAATAAPVAAAPDFVSKPARPASTLAASSGTSLIAPLDDVTFAHDSATLGSAAIDQVRSAAAWLKKHPQQRIVIEGYADHTGTVAYNLELSQRRAYAVRQQLVRRGIDPDRIVMAVYGERAATGAADDLDRRVVMYASDRPVNEIVTGTLHLREAVTVIWSRDQVLVTEGRGGAIVQVATR